MNYHLSDPNSKFVVFFKNEKRRFATDRIENISLQSDLVVSIYKLELFFFFTCGGRERSIV